MGPRSSDRGNPDLDYRNAAFPRTFNGAAIFRPRKYVELHSLTPEQVDLQWGRDLPTAEIGEPGLSPNLTFRLQWGRDLPTAEIQSAFDLSNQWSYLQWGRDLPTAEIRN